MIRTKFSRSNPPTGSYVYLYLRRDGTPYYVGKGTGARAWESKSHVTKPHKNLKNIVVIEWGLTDTWALIRERYYIRWFGRIDIGSGILRNLNDGGTGSGGAVPWNKGKEMWSLEDRARIGRQNKARGPQTSDTIEKRVKKNTGKKRTAAQKQNLRNGRWGGDNSNWTPSEKSKIQMSQSRRAGVEAGTIVPHNKGVKMDCPAIGADHWRVKNLETNTESTIYSLRKFCEANGISYGALWKCAKAGRPHKGFLVEKVL